MSCKVKMAAKMNGGYLTLKIVYSKKYPLKNHPKNLDRRLLKNFQTLTRFLSGLLQTHSSFSSELLRVSTTKPLKIVQQNHA